MQSSAEDNEESNIISLFNETYNVQDLLNIEKCKEIHEQLQNEIHELEASIADNDESRVGKTLRKAEEFCQNADEALKSSRLVLHDVSAKTDEIDELRGKIHTEIAELNEQQCTLQYLRIAQQIEILSVELEREVKKGDNERCATVYANFCEISRSLVGSKAANMRGYLKETICYWHEILKGKLQREFEDILKALKWPFVNANSLVVLPIQNQTQKLQLLSEYLLQIELPAECTQVSDTPQIILPVQLLIAPLRKRFIYHFYGTRQTNRPDKPEWYFTQILTWVRDHEAFVDQTVQPVIEKLGLHHVDAKVEMIQGLVQLAIEKLSSDLPNLQFDDFTFSHTIDEALGFDKELRESFNYPQHKASIVSVLTQPSIFFKWLSMEKKYAIEKMDSMLPPTALDAFDAPTVGDELDEYKITTCANAFSTLLQSITERYVLLLQPGHRLQFLEMQLDLLDDFRVRLIQLSNEETCNVVESRIPMIANTIFYLENVLIDWGSMLHYLNLHYYKSQFQVEENKSDDLESESTVFSTILANYKIMREDLLKSLVDSIMYEVKTRSGPYIRQRWSTIPMEKDFKCLSLSPTACQFLEIVAKRLHQLQKNLQAKLFAIVWRSLASAIDKYFFERLILDSRFSTGGVMQLKQDVVCNLFPLFSQYTEKPQNYFIQLLESINLLSISKGSALLLKETLLALADATGAEDIRQKSLKEIGATSFQPEIALKVLNQRLDVTVNRIDKMID